MTGGDSYLICTDEPNDADLARALGSRASVLPIAAGDILFSGIGRANQPILISCERKKIPDLASCIHTSRYLHQLQIAAEAEVDVFCLILEGRYRRNPDDGMLDIKLWRRDPATQRPRDCWEPVIPAITYSRFEQYLTELARDIGVIIKRTEDVRGTADAIEALYWNFQSPWGEHSSLCKIYKQPPPVVQLVKPSLARRIASELPGIGWDWSAVVAACFPTVSDMLNASVSDWAALEHTSESGRTRKLGETAAQKIVASLGKNSP